MIECDNFPLLCLVPHMVCLHQREGGEKERRGERERERKGGREEGERQRERERDRIFIETTLKGVGMDVPMLET